MGIDDLINKVARTPIDPIITFSDDPLRILRTIRFVHKFNLSISDEIKKAVMSEKILNLFIKNLTNDRIMTEFDKILKGRNPHISLQ